VSCQNSFTPNNNNERPTVPYTAGGLELYQTEFAYLCAAPDLARAYLLASSSDSAILDDTIELNLDVLDDERRGEADWPVTANEQRPTEILGCQDEHAPGVVLAVHLTNFQTLADRWGARFAHTCCRIVEASLKRLTLAEDAVVSRPAGAFEVHWRSSDRANARIQAARIARLLNAVCVPWDGQSVMLVVSVHSIDCAS
jgi:hypothetical protein